MSMAVRKSELEDTSSNTAFPTFVAQYEANWENHDTEIVEDDYEADNQCHEELYEEKYWEQSELSKKESGTKKKSVSERCKELDDNFITYRKTNSKDQKERQLNKGYKLDRTTALLVEKLIDVRNIGLYHDAIGESRNSIVIVAGKTATSSYSFKNAIKIYKLTSDDRKNKTIFRRAQREFEHMGYTYSYMKRVCYCKNVIVMQHVGTDDEPALPITMVPPDLCFDLYYKLVSHITYLRIIHGNLNCKNVLYWKASPYIIGWTHSVHFDHPNAQKKLMADCYFVTEFFKSRGVPVKSTETLFKEIMKVREISKEALDVLERKRRSANCSGESA